MSRSKFCVFSGFLGAGKTTAMMALTRYYSARHGKAAMISNDLGHGVTLADHRLAKLEGCNASEITEDCICYLHDQLAERLDACFSEGCDLVVSDIPGFGVGALDHVYHGLSQSFPGVYELAPFTVLIEPDTVRNLRSGSSGDMEYILRMQLQEADLIVLSKSDTIEEEEIRKCMEWLRQQVPSAEVLAVSAVTGAGLEELSLYLKEHRASMKQVKVDYQDTGFTTAMDQLSEYYIQYHAAVCCNTFDGTAYLKDLAEQVQQRLKEAGGDVPHLKLLAWEPEGDFGKVDLIGVDRPVQETRRFQKPCTELAVILNASAICQGSRFRQMMLDTVKEISEQYQLELIIFKEEKLEMGG